MLRAFSHPFIAVFAVLSTSSIGIAGTLTRVWETAPVMAKPESAVYDAARDLIYVSNINGEYFARDGNGFIAAVRPDGSVADARCIKEGLDNPQGLALSGDKLYVADNEHVCCISVSSGVIETRYEVEGAEFCNDACADDNGDIYVSDTFANRVYRIREGKMSLWLEGPEVQAPNGLATLPDSVMVLMFEAGKCYMVNKETKAMELFCDGIANADGITSDGMGGFFISGAWQGQVFHVSARGEKALVLDLGDEKTIAADICYIPEKHLLVVPTLDKKVMGFRWDPSAAD